jgi:hypothetical protein
VQRYNKKCTYASKRTIIFKKDRLNYLIRFPLLAQARLKAMYWTADNEGVNRFLKTIASVCCMRCIVRK